MKQKMIIAILGLGVVSAIGLFLPFKRDESVFTLHGVMDIPVVAISFQVPGKVANLFFAKQELVQQGAVMAVLDKAPYETALALAEASLTKAESTLQQATRTQERYAQLLQAGATSQTSYKETVRARGEAHTQFAIAKAQLEEAQAHLAATVIYAPNRGYVRSRLVEPGVLVVADAPVYLLSLGSSFIAKAYVSEVYLARVQLGQEAVLITDTGERYQGKVTGLSAQAELIPRDSEVAQFLGDSMYRIEITVENPSTQLRQGMPVTLHL